MKLTDLRNWKSLTPVEKKRLKAVYGTGELGVTKTVAQPAKSGKYYKKDRGIA